MLFALLPSIAFAVGLPDTGDVDSDVAPVSAPMAVAPPALVAPPPAVSFVTPPPPSVIGWMSQVWNGLWGTSTSSSSAFEPECGCSIAMPIDILESYVDPDSRDTVPHTISFSIPCLNEGEPLIVHQDDRTSSPITGASWYGWVAGSPTERVVVTRVDGVYVATLMLAEGAWEIHGRFGETGRAYCELEEVEGDEDTGALEDTGAPTPPPASPPPPGSSAGGCPETPEDWPEIDVLVVYTDQARINRGGASGTPSDADDVRALAAHGIATTYDSLRNSNVEVSVRGVGIAPTSFDDSTIVDACDLRVRGAAEADVRAARTASGADLVFIMGDRVPGHYAGCALTARWEDPDPTGPAPGIVDVSGRSLGLEIGDRADAAANMWQVTTHEFGHTVGLCHAPQNGCSRRLVNPNYAFGYISESLATTPPYNYRTLMATRASAGCGFLGQPPCGKINFFSTPYLIYPGADLAVIEPAAPRLGNSSTFYSYQAPTGVEFFFASNAKQALEKTAPHFESLGAAPPSLRNVFDPSGPQPYDLLTCDPASPPGYCDLPFAWSPPIAATSVRLQLVQPGGPFTVLHDSGNLSVGSAVARIATSAASGPLRVRLWSYFPATAVQQTPAWSFEDFTFNVAGSFVDCSGEDAFIVPHAAFDGASCLPASSDRCEEERLDTDTGAFRLDCGLAASSPGGPGGFLVSITPRDVGFTSYDFAVMGTDPGGAKFCCLHYAQPRLDLQQVRLTGTSGSDRVGFVYPPYNLLRGETCLTTSWARGVGGDDELLGTADPRIGDILGGGAGHDLVQGLDGDDQLRGWYGEDILVGGSGDDVLIENVTDGGVINELYGEDGDDVLCGLMLYDLYVSSLPTAASTPNDDNDIIYVAQNGTQFEWNPGTTSHGAYVQCGGDIYEVGGPPECDTTWLTTIPEVCSAFFP